MSRVVLDTSALLYWTLSPERLTKTARRAIAKGEHDGILVSAISVWEIGLKVQRGALSLGLPFNAYVQRLQRADALTLVPVDLRVWLHVLDMPWSHRDPADRVIVATAEINGLPLVSSDATIGKYYANTLWR